MISRRKVLTCICGLTLIPFIQKSNASTSLPSIPAKTHEIAMRAAIKEAMKNPGYPFGAVITNANSGLILAAGVNTSRINPTFHGEIVCMNNYVALHGNKNWKDLILYTTGEPCPMCMSALIWAGIGGVVYASSIDTISNSGIGQINLSAQSVINASDVSKPWLLAGVLREECDLIFMKRKHGNSV
jgi:tRNA(adenine34) deaminase